jgi:hypothetical protein
VPPMGKRILSPENTTFFCICFLDLEILEVVRISIFVGLGFTLHMPGMLV